MGEKPVSTMTMLVTALVILGMSSRLRAAGDGCEYDTRPGFFSYNYTGTGWDGPSYAQDDLPTYGEEIEVSVASTSAAIFNAHFTKLKVTDYGVIFPSKAGGSYESGYGDYPVDFFNNADHSYVTPNWLEDDTTGAEYRVAVDHIVDSTLVDNGLKIGPRYCDLRRIEQMINRCDEDPRAAYTTRGEIEIEEAVIVTWRISKTGEVDYVFQAVIAFGVDKDNFNEAETFVIFIYEDDKPIWIVGTVSEPFINGRYSGNREYAKPCPPDSGSWKDNTNCRCENFLTGVYVFAVKDNDGDTNDVWKRNICTYNSATAYDAKCAASGVTETRATFQQNCGPSRPPQDSCRDEITCSLNEGSSNWEVLFAFKYIGNLTKYVFVDENVRSSDGACTGDISVEGDVGYVEKRLSSSNIPCLMTSSGGYLEGGIRLYQSEFHADVTWGGGRTLYFKCRPDDLPYILDVDFEGDHIMRVTESYNSWEVFGWWTYTRVFNEFTQEEDKIPDGTPMAYAAHVYLSIALDYADLKVNVQAYAVYVMDCWVSNNENFVHSGTDYTLQIVDDGCNTQTTVFAFEDEFVGQHLDENGGIGDYNFVTTTGMMEAHKWQWGSDKLYFMCTLGFCFNRAEYMNSRCYLSCTNNDFVDFETPERRKRNDGDQDTVTVRTSLTIMDPQGDVGEQASCVGSTVAISTLVALLVILIMSMLVTLMLFMKLRARQKK